MNDRWCVRCGRRGPTPFLKKMEPTLWEYCQERCNGGIPRVADLGCGNGRNVLFMRQDPRGHTWIVHGLDMAPTGCEGCSENFRLGQDRFPYDDQSVNLFLANYSLMFLDKDETIQVMREINRTADDGALLVVEMYPARDSETPNDDMIRDRMTWIAGMMRGQPGYWGILYNAKSRMILQKELAVPVFVHQDRFRRTMRIVNKENR